MNEAQVLLATNHQSDWRIVIPTEPSYLTRHAADEIAAFVKESSGAELPIVTAQEAAQDFEIVLAGARTCCQPVHELKGGVNDEDYVVFVSDTQIWIAGSGLRGTLYGAYAFLEEALGVRFLTSSCNYVPKRTMLTVPHLSIYDQPTVAMRIKPYKCIDSFNHQGRMRINMGSGDPKPGEEEFGINEPYSYGHSINTIVPDSLYDEHPEYFPEIDGRRRHGDYHQRCLTNPDVLRMAIDWARDTLRANPGQRMIAIGQNDTFPDQPNNCHCPACQAIDDEEGVPMGSLLRFVNAVAEAIEPEFPDVLVTTLAYRYTRKPPKITKPRHNVVIVLCSIECCFSHAMTSHCGSNYIDGPIGTVSNEEFVEDVKGWSAIADHLFIWDYVTDFPYYLTPHPDFRTLAPNMQFFVDNKVCGVYPEGAHDVIGAEMDELRTYMLCRLMWNPWADWESDMQEFLVGALGVAAVPVMKYLNMLHDHVEKNNIHMSTYHKPDEIMFPDWLLKEVDDLFDRAERLAKDDAALKLVRRLRMSIRYVKLFLHGRKLPLQERERLHREFYYDMQLYGIDALNEGGNYDDSKKHLNRILGL